MTMVIKAICDICKTNRVATHGVFRYSHGNEDTVLVNGRGNQNWEECVFHFCDSCIIYNLQIHALRIDKGDKLIQFSGSGIEDLRLLAQAALYCVDRSPDVKANMIEDNFKDRVKASATWLIDLIESHNEKEKRQDSSSSVEHEESGPMERRIDDE